MCFGTSLHLSMDQNLRYLLWGSVALLLYLFSKAFWVFSGGNVLTLDPRTAALLRPMGARQKHAAECLGWEVPPVA